MDLSRYDLEIPSEAAAAIRKLNSEIRELNAQIVNLQLELMRVCNQRIVNNHESD